MAKRTKAKTVADFAESFNAAITAWNEAHASEANPFEREMEGEAFAPRFREPTLRTIRVELSFDDRLTWGDSIVLTVEPGIVMRGQSSGLFPGVAYRETFDVNDARRAIGFTSFGEIIAYGINEGNATMSFIEGDDSCDEANACVWWRVKASDVPYLRALGVVS